MGSCSPQLPIICLSDQTLKPGSSKWAEVRSDVRKALEEYGGFEARCDEVAKLQESFLEVMKEIFALPKESKQRNVVPKPFTGYLSNDLHESLGFEDAHILEKAQDFTRLLWPESEGNKSISKAIQLIFKKLVDLDTMVKRLVMESFGLEKYIDEILTSTYYRMRLMKYMPPPVSDGVEANVDAEEEKLGFPGHTDKAYVGLIYQYDQTEGLEVRTKEGKWIRVKPAPDGVIILGGDALCAFLNGRINTGYHRVKIMENKKTRYSAVMFSIPKQGYIIDSPKELVDEEHPRVFKPFKLEDLFHFSYNTEAGRRSQSPLHDFCAVSGN